MATQQQSRLAWPATPIAAAPATAPIPAAVLADLSARETEQFAGVGTSLLVAQDGLATIRNRETDDPWVSADPTQAVWVARRANIAIDAGTSGDCRFSVIVFGGIDDNEPWLRAIPWAPRRMLRLTWAARRVHRAFANTESDGPRVPQFDDWPSDAREEVAALVVDAVHAGARRRAALGRPEGRAFATHGALTESAKRVVVAQPARLHALSDVAYALNTSPYHLAHVFRVHAGLSFHRFIIHYRIAIALAELLADELPLSSLALRLGFATHSHFTAAFHRAVGYPPSRIRKIVDAPHPPFAEYWPGVPLRSDSAANRMRYPCLLPSPDESTALRRR
ncbi:MAG TPA: AraC family transcriptional regulator [Gemmatimonadaceae bacterium]|nr:AraC family transcriptional regulator [Gemmatimonadaceae bacterium]